MHNVTHSDHLYMPLARTDIRHRCCCNITDARLWRIYFNIIIQLWCGKNFRTNIWKVCSEQMFTSKYITLCSSVMFCLNHYMYIPSMSNWYGWKVWTNRYSCWDNFTLKLLQSNRSYCCTLGAVSIRKTVLSGMAIPMLKIRRPNGRLIFNMEITIRR